MTNRPSATTKIGAFIYNSDGGVSGWNTDATCYRTGTSNLFSVEEVEFTDNDVVLRKAGVGSDGNGYGTVYLPFNATIPEGVKAFYGEVTVAPDGQGNELTMNQIGDETLRGGTAVVLVNEGQTEDKKTVTFVPSTKSGTEVTGNALHGTALTTEMGSDKVFVLNGADAELAFRPYSGMNLPLYRAYLLNPNDNGINVKGFALNFGGAATGIDHVTGAADETAGKVFDLSGRRVKQPAKGLYIVGGQKVLVK